MQYVIKTNALLKKYGEKAAVDKVSIHVKKGDIYGLIGKNGAGKTTLMRILLGLSNATDGEIEMFESTDLDKARTKIGSLIEAPALLKNETGINNLKRFAILCPTPEARLHELMDLVGLGHAKNKRVGGYSLGMRQRLGIAVALLGNPELLILDEPINGLDPAGIKEIRDVIVELNEKGVTFVISSHLLDELGKIATNYGIMANGQLVEEITAAELEARCRTALKIVVNNAPEAVKLIRELIPDVELEQETNTIHVLTPVEDSSVLVEALVKNGIRVYEIAGENKNLEEFFIERLG